MGRIDAVIRRCWQEWVDNGRFRRHDELDSSLSTIRRTTRIRVSTMNIHRRLTERNLPAHQPLSHLRIVSRDESRFHLCPDDHQRRVWRWPGQRADPAFIIAKQQGVMIWRKISFDAGPIWSSVDGHLQHMGTEEEEEDEEDTGEEEKDEPKPKSDISEEPKPEISEAELAMEKMRKKKEEEEAMWAEYIEQRKKQKAKEEEELRKLKERQMKRKERRKEEEKKLLALKKQQEAQRIKEMEEKKAREAEAKKKRLEEAEKKRQAMQDALQRNKIQEPVTPNFIITKRNEDGSVVPGIDKFPSSLYMKAEMSKTKEQLAEDKKIALNFRVKPLQIENLSVAELKQRALQLWDAIVRLESENDCFVSMSTMSQRSHLTDSEAWRVVGRLEGGQTQAEIVQAIECPKV
ncbi:troponin T [Trichonephila clavipes]|uniref:Troponin T n=1 Tax=Trichonephila clavipes TaxID=2585209 RepID=A0A8X6SDY3_TRICX|nr:troponin T [Trichonephila clavipes]